MSDDVLPIGTVLEHPCPKCGSKMVLKDSRYGLFYGCTAYPRCDATHGAHRATGQPLGIPGDDETKRARIKAHREFDKLWTTGAKRNRMSRKGAYTWMQKTLGLSPELAHIGMMSIEQCASLVRAVKKELSNRSKIGNEMDSRSSARSRSHRSSRR